MGVRLKHFKTIMTHKKWVFYCARRLGIGWQGFWHDMSKFSPTEFNESIRFYSGTRSPIDAAKEAQGYSLAWQNHKGRNRHHYEYWQDNFDKGTTHLKMPDKYVKEMICDYLAAGKAYNGNKFTLAGEYQWWLNKRETCKAMCLDNKVVVQTVLEHMNSRWPDKDLVDLTKENWQEVRFILEDALRRATPYTTI